MPCAQALAAFKQKIAVGGEPADGFLPTGRDLCRSPCTVFAQSFTENHSASDIRFIHHRIDPAAPRGVKKVPPSCCPQGLAG